MTLSVADPMLWLSLTFRRGNDAMKWASLSPEGYDRSALISIEEVHRAQLSSGEFSHAVREMRHPGIEPGLLAWEDSLL